MRTLQVFLASIGTKKLQHNVFELIYLTLHFVSCYVTTALGHRDVNVEMKYRPCAALVEKRHKILPIAKSSNSLTTV